MQMLVAIVPNSNEDKILRNATTEAREQIEAYGLFRTRLREMSSYSAKLRKIKNDDIHYLGEFDISGLRKGFGISVYQDGSVYEGDFNNDKPNGMGRKTYDNGS